MGSCPSQVKDYKIGICFFSAKHAALRSKSKDWLARNQNNVSEWHADLDFYSARSLKQQSTDRYVAPLGHIILIPSQPVFALTP
jgi:hypothetical protein